MELNLDKIKNKYPELNNTFIESKIKVLFPYLKKNYNVLFNDILNFINDNKLNERNGIKITFNEKVYLYLNNIKSFPKCKYCNSIELNFKNLRVSYLGSCKNCKSGRKDIIDKRKKTILKKFGNTVFMNSKKGKIKLKEKEDFNLKKYGVKHYFQSDEFKEKSKITLLDKYGVDNSGKTKQNIDKNKKQLIKKIETGNYIYKKSNNGYYKINHISKGHDFEIFNQTLTKRLEIKDEICTICNKLNKPISNLEIELKNIINEFINDSKIELLGNVRFKDDIGLSKYELDIYIPELNLGVEFNGLYWHSINLGKESNYHKNKLDFFNKKGIRLIQIFEDEWLFKKDIVLSRVKYIINGLLVKKNYNSKLNDKIKIGGRNIKISPINYKDSKEFLDKYHIQGSDKSRFKYGAFYEKILIGVMTFGMPNISKGGKKTGKIVYELNRFAVNNNYIISGLSSKMLRYFQKNVEYDEIFSYADRRWSNGDVYKKLGFKLDSISKPNYFYFDNKNKLRKHRYNFRKSILLEKYPIYKEKINLISGKKYTEFEIMKELGYYQIYDAGNLKFSIKK